MRLNVQVHLDYGFEHPTDTLLQIEAAALPDQRIEAAKLQLSPVEQFARVPAHDGIGERIWIRTGKRLTADYTATIAITREPHEWRSLPRVEPHRLPGEVIQYLFGSRYCQSDLFPNFVDAEFAGLCGGARVMAIRDWIQQHFAYVPGVSNAETTAIESFTRREGVCRDYAHVLITLVRACGIPARMASVYALGVEPQDFHAVGEVFLGGEWHLVDATGMAKDGAMARIGVGRDAADISFLTAYGFAAFNALRVRVSGID